MNDTPDRVEDPCPDCQAGPDSNAATITKARKDPETGDLIASVTWHHADCPTYAVEKILLEDGARRAREDRAHGMKALPAAYERLIYQVGKASPSEFSATTQPFVAALVELVEEQIEDMDRFVPPDRWAEILDKHFPPNEPTT